MILTKKLLRELANSKSYARGRNYYSSDNVNSIIRKGDTFEGTIIGTHFYNVKIELTSNGINSYCSCPYDHGGICKHIVAMGLAIIDGQYTVAKQSEFLKNTKQENILLQLLPSTQTFNQFFDSVLDKRKIDFLKHMLEKNNDLREQFLRFCAANTVETKNKKNKKTKIEKIIHAKTHEQIEGIKEEINIQLINLEFGEPDSESHYYDYGYNSDELYDRYKEQIEEVFEPYGSVALAKMKRGDVFGSIEILLGMYEGYLNVNKPAQDEFDYMDDYNSELQTVFVEWIEKISAIYKGIVPRQEDVENAFDLLLQRKKSYDAELTKLSKLEQQEVNIYNIYPFTELIALFVYEESLAAYIESELRKNNWYVEEAVKVFLKIADLTDDQHLWLAVSSDYGHADLEVCKELLPKYEELGLDAELHKIAKKAYAKFGNSIDEFLLDYISYEQDKDLYIKVLEGFTKRKSYLLGYRKLTKIWTATEKEVFIQSCKQTYQTVFYVQILAVEKRYEEIFSIVTSKNLHTSNLETVMQPILNIYPDECLAILEEKIKTSLLKNRGRKYYQEIVNWLKIAQKVTNRTKKIQNLVKFVTSFTLRLRALKDEMQKGGLL